MRRQRCAPSWSRSGHGPAAHARFRGAALDRCRKAPRCDLGDREAAAISEGHVDDTLYESRAGSRAAGAARKHRHRHGPGVTRAVTPAIRRRLTSCKWEAPKSQVSSTPRWFARVVARCERCTPDRIWTGRSRSPPQPAGIAARCRWHEPCCSKRCRCLRAQNCGYGARLARSASGCCRLAESGLMLPFGGAAAPWGVRRDHGFGRSERMAALLGPGSSRGTRHTTAIVSRGRLLPGISPAHVQNRSAT